MKWQSVKTHPWQEPLAFTAVYADEPEAALLYSGQREKHTGVVSYLFIGSLEQKQGSQWSELPGLENDTLPDWVGYLGYSMRDESQRGNDAVVSLPDFWLTRYAKLFRFDHEKKIIEEFGRGQTKTNSPKVEKNIEVTYVGSTMERAEYESIVRETVERIHAGDFYQANITRKFYGAFTALPDSWRIFERLCTASPAPYSAYIRHGDVAILSSSPECFLTIADDGSVISRPIKGSAARDTDPALLAASDKNQAENLMIVDLMRNDLSKVSEPGSVEVLEQSGIYSYATVHHLVSTVRAKKRTDIEVYDTVRACFPPGSMTGTPKRAAVKWCTEKERYERGVYSGAIGWFTKNTCDLSVVIRTLIIKGDRFEFQVGGGIVAQSDPKDEWQETLVKARGIAKALGIAEEDLAAL